jgi:hypothetical protein
MAEQFSIKLNGPLALVAQDGKHSPISFGLHVFP